MKRAAASRFSALEAESMGRRGELVRMAHSGGGGAVDVTATTQGPWTVAEYDPTTGAVINTFDRGRRRSAALVLLDTGVIYHEDDDGEWLYTCGGGHLSRHFATVQKWDMGGNTQVWQSDTGAFTGPVFATTANGTGSNKLCIADDGFIWCLGTDGTGTSNTCAGRFDPATGSQTHKYAMSGITTVQVKGIYALDGGKVLVVAVVGIGGTKLAVVLDDTASEVATWTGSSFNDLAIDIASSRIVAVMTGGTDPLKVLDFSLTALDQRTSPGSGYGVVDADGTTIWVTTGSTVRAYDATSLATELWNGANDADVANSFRIIHKNNALYTFAAKIRKHSDTTGAEIWESPASGLAFPSVRTQGRNGCAVGSNFVMVASSDTNEHIFCLNDSDGSVRWYDTNASSCTVHVTDDDRIFVAGPRIGP